MIGFISPIVSFQSNKVAKEKGERYLDGDQQVLSQLLIPFRL